MELPRNLNVRSRFCWMNGPSTSTSASFRISPVTPGTCFRPPVAGIKPDVLLRELRPELPEKVEHGRLVLLLHRFTAEDRNARDIGLPARLDNLVSLDFGELLAV